MQSSSFLRLDIHTCVFETSVTFQQDDLEIQWPAFLLPKFYYFTSSKRMTTLHTYNASTSETSANGIADPTISLTPRNLPHTDITT